MYASHNKQLLQQVRWETYLTSTCNDNYYSDPSTADYFLWLERSISCHFPTEYRKTKTKVITAANEKKVKYPEGPMRSPSKPRKNAVDLVACDWLRELRGFSKPITEQGEKKPMRSRGRFLSVLNFELPQRKEWR